MLSASYPVDWDSVVGTVFAVWFVVIALRQVGSIQSFMKGFRLLLGRTVPQWHLFTGDLRELNVSVYVRDLLDGGGVTEWREIPPLGRGGTAKLSFRERRAEYACARLARGLVCSTAARPGSDAAAELTRSLMAKYEYQVLLNFARAHPAGPDARGRQFLLATNAADAGHAVGLEEMTRRAAPFPFPRRVVRVVTPFHPLQPGGRLMRPIASAPSSRPPLRRVA